MKHLKKIQFAMLLTVIVYAGLLAQQPKKTLQDGFSDLQGGGITGFTITNYDSGISAVIIDSSQVLRLAPNIDTLIFKQPGGWSLSGIQWQYDNNAYSPGDVGYISRAIDVDDISRYIENRDSTVYLITDFNQNNVMIHHVGRTPQVITEQVVNETGPADAHFYVQDAIKYVLVTYQSTNKVVKIDAFLRTVLWSYGGDDQPGTLASPSDAVKIENSDEIVIADTGNRRVIVVNETTKTVEWEFSETVFNPVDVEAVGSSQFLVTDQAGHRVILINRVDQSIIWQWGTGTPGNSRTELFLPSDADWVPETQMVLIADRGNNRIIEVSPADSTHYYEWPNAVNGVNDVDAALDLNQRVTGGFLVSQKEVKAGLDHWLPTVLAFAPPADKEGPLASTVAIIRNTVGGDREVDFQNITLYAHDSPLTTIEYQFRSAPINARIDENTNWMGPTGGNSRYSYIDSISVPLYTFHKPHTSCQFGAHLSTDSLRITPQIDSVAVEYNYYNVSSTGNVFLRPDALIGPLSTAPVSVAWDTLTLFWKRVEIADEKLLEELRYTLTISNAQGGATLLELSDRKPTNGPQKIILTNESGLRGAKQITFALALKTLNSGLTPQLDGWRFAWREFDVGPPSIQFTDSTLAPQPFYTATTYIPGESDSIFVDKAYLRLSNVLEADSTLYVSITAPATNDVMADTLVFDSMRQLYKSRTGKPIILLAANQVADATNDMLELYDRDSLYVDFVSTQRPGEILSDTIMVVQGTVGTLFIQNSVRQNTTEAHIGQSIHLRVEGEIDRSLNLIAQDSINVLLRNDMTNDTEWTTLYEEDAAGVYNTGIFVTRSAINLTTNSNSPPDDGELYSRQGDRISAQYKDNFKKVATYRFIVIPDTIVPQTFVELGCEVAPNPYRERDGHNFRMRVKSDLGDVTLERLEIYNFAGEKVLDIAGSTIAFSNTGGNNVSRYNWGYVENWWNFLNSSGQSIASGTYWLKVTANVNQQKLSAKTKFVVIR